MLNPSSFFRGLNSIVGPLATSGLASPLPVGTGLVMLETIGRTSGKPRQVPLLATRLGGKVFVSTVRADSQWLRNLEAEPRAQVWLGGFPRAAMARVTRGALNIVELTL